MLLDIYIKNNSEIDPYLYMILGVVFKSIFVHSVSGLLVIISAITAHLLPLSQTITCDIFSRSHLSLKLLTEDWWGPSFFHIYGIVCPFTFNKCVHKVTNTNIFTHKYSLLGSRIHFVVVLLLLLFSSLKNSSKKFFKKSFFF